MQDADEDSSSENGQVGMVLEEGMVIVDEQDRQEIRVDVKTEDVEIGIEEHRTPPVPQPRRSIRERKPPDKYKDYQMNQMVPRPLDYKIQALNALMNSGVLDEVDCETAHRLVGAVMN